MNRTFSSFALALLVCAEVPAATINTKLTVTSAALTLGVSASLSGPASLSNIGTGTIAAPSLTANAQGNYSGAFTITLTGGGGSGTITGALNIPASAIAAAATGGQISGSATVSGGTYSGGVTGGSFPSLAGTGSFGVSGISISFSGDGTVITGTGGGGTPVPTITSVQDAASNTPNIAQGSIFIVKGSNLSAAGYTPFAPPRPQVSSGVKVTFTPVSGGGAPTDAYLVYLFNQNGVNQIACILPSTVAVGSYNVTVTNGTASAPVVAQVVANKIGLFTQDSTGGGLASVQNYISASVVDLNRLTTGTVGGVTISPAKPGQAVIAYGTGLGAYAAGDNSASPVFDFRSSLDIKAVVGGVTIPVDYAGRAGYAGEDQINFTLPAGIPTGCAVTLQISVNGRLSAPTSIAIAPDANSTACVMPGFTTQQLQNFDNGGTYTAGSFAITQFAVTVPGTGIGSGTFKTNGISGGFIQLTGFQLASASQVNPTINQQGSCTVSQSVSGSGSNAAATGTINYLDAGTVTITGPAGSSLTNQALNKTNNLYSYTNVEGISLPGQANFSLPAGDYTLNGAGGVDVGTFNTKMTLSPLLTVTGGLPNSVTRSAGLTLNWTGGNAADLVEIIGSSSTSTGTGTSTVTTTTTFICLTTAGAKTFNVPASVLNQLPANSGTATGLLEIASGNYSTTFSPTLKTGSGGTIPSFFGNFIGLGNSVTYQ